MGNRHESGQTAFINPTEHPYLHVMRLGQEWNYVAQLSGLEIEIGTEVILPNGITSVENAVGINIELLEKPTKIPPPQIESANLVRSKISDRAEEILKALTEDPEADIIAFSHGYAWGLQPEEVVAELIQDKYRAGGVFQIGGRKKMQINAFRITKIIPSY